MSTTSVLLSVCCAGRRGYRGMQIVGYRLLEKMELMQEGDVLGSVGKTPIIPELWAGQPAKKCNQPVYRPLRSFEDFYKRGE